jgi:hypothetical protein
MISNTSFSTRLRAKLSLAYGTKQPDFSISSQYSPDWYKNYLLTTYSIIRSSVPLMQAAHDQCRKMKEEELLMELEEYYVKHIQEELHHDEWLLDDLESIGCGRNESLSRKPIQEVAELVGSQFYWIYYWHPVCLLGYISVLEGNPPKNENISRLKQTTGYPDAAFRTLIKHSSLDPYHRDDLNNLLDSLHLSPIHEKWITSNSLHTAKKLWEIRCRHY